MTDKDEIVKAFDFLLQRKRELSPIEILLDPTLLKSESPNKLERKKQKPLKPKEFKYKDYMDKNLGIQRSEMPQIDPENIDEFLIHFADKTKVKKLEKKLSDLKPTQGEINDDKIFKKIKKKSNNWKERKYITSLDGYLLDGHHDWAHGIEMNPDQEVVVYRVGLPIKKLLSRTKRLNISNQLDIDDNQINKAEEILFRSLENSVNPKILSRKILDNSSRFTNELVFKAKTYV